MATPLLEIKLYIPPTRAELVPRPRLLERLNAGLDRKLTLISAPAGFGRTTLLSEWVAACRRPVAWLSLDEGDNDPARFITYLIAALQSVNPEIGQAAQAMMGSLQPPNSLYARSRGVHAAGLLDPEKEELLAIVEDVGRHNTIDKLMGCCLKHGMNPRGKVLLVTGRTSSEMLRNAARMGCPITASRTSPTSLSVEMARAWNITLVGYVHSGRLRVYSQPERLAVCRAQTGFRCFTV
jgi:hypothetical protein